MVMWQVVAFVIATCGLIYISRATLRQPGSHGFYRFFAWELIVALFLLNLPNWVRDPLAWHQLISWCLLLVSIIPLVLGVRALRARGRPDARRRSEPGLLGFERTTVLVTDGVYRFIRHPLYSSLFILAWGIYFKSPSWPGFLFSAAASMFLAATARADEAECVKTFGAEHKQYAQLTRMFIPYVY